MSRDEKAAGPPTEIWEIAFREKQTMWGFQPTRSAILAKDLFVQHGVKDVLIPGVGYGRNAQAFLENGMAVSGIEISETAIALARTKLGLTIPIHHGSVANMPYDQQQYGGIFCYGLVYLLDAPGRKKLIRDCYQQLTLGGHMMCTVIAKTAPMYKQGTQLGEDWYEILPGIKMYFYDADSIRREFGPYGLVEISQIDEPTPHGGTLPFLNVICKRS